MHLLRRPVQSLLDGSHSGLQPLELWIRPFRSRRPRLSPQRLTEFFHGRAKLELQLLLGTNGVAQFTTHLREHFFELVGRRFKGVTGRAFSFVMKHREFFKNTIDCCFVSDVFS
jgi:hypothetical protein